MFIRIGIGKTRNTDDFLGSGTKLLLPSLSLGFRHEEKERHTIFSMLTVRPSSALNSLTQPTRVRTLQFTNWTGLAQGRKINTLRLSSNLNFLLLFKITKNPSPSLQGMTSFAPPVLFPICVFYSNICDCHILPARAWTPALMSAPTHALSRKVLSLTKPKEKIYKTKNDNVKKILPQLYNSFDLISPDVFILSCCQKRFGFSLEVSFS